MSKPNTPEDSAQQARKARGRARLNRWVWLLDEAIRIPVINVRVGLDAIIGFVPVIGDFAGAALSSVVFMEAVRMRAPRELLTRMGRNIVTDFLLGLVPVFGDVFDVAWRANRRNLNLLEDWLQEDKPSKARRRWPAFLLGAILLGIAALVSWAVWRLLITIF